MNDPLTTDRELSQRERLVLEAIIDAHIASAEPIGSRTLSSHPGLSCSPATIRNVMASLHDLGLIEKPHSSSGRVPTTRGLRLYLDSLLKLKDVAPEAGEIESRVAAAQGVDRAVEEAGRVLARLSRNACIVRAPRQDAARLKQIELVRLRDDAIVVVLVTMEGLVLNRLIDLHRTKGGVIAPQTAPDTATLNRMSGYLSECVAGRTFAEAQRALADELAKVQAEADRLKASAVALGQTAVAEHDTGIGGVLVAGESHLLGSSDGVAELQRLLGVIEEKTELLELLEVAESAEGIQVFVGEENPLRAMAGLSVVAAPYGGDGRVFGAMAVIGPRHMDYGRVVPLVELTASAIGRLLHGVD